MKRSQRIAAHAAIGCLSALALGSSLKEVREIAIASLALAIVNTVCEVQDHGAG